MNVLRSLLLTAAVLCAAAAARAQSVHWEPADNGDPASLQLLFEGCAPSGTPDLPSIDGVTLTQTGTSNQMTVTNGSFSRSVAITYEVRARRGGGRVEIPAFTVQTSSGTLTVPAYTIGAAAPALDVGVHSTFVMPASSVWAGEIFPLTYSVSVPQRSFNQLGGDVEWNASPLIAEDWPKEPQAIRTTVNGEERLDIFYKTRAYVKTPGTVTLNAAQQLVNLQTGSTGFGFFTQPRLEQVSVTSNRPTLTVRPLPAGAPASFNGAVGSFTLTAKVVPETASVGEPVTWTLTLAGTGNWPAIPGLPAREVSRDFKVVQPQAKRTPAEGKIFDASLNEDIVLVPTRAGTYTLGPVSYACFDPKSGTYRTLTTQKFTVTVTPAAAPLGSVPASGSEAPAAPETSAATPPARAPASPAAPKPIPRDPLPGAAHAPAPLPARTWAVGIAAPFGAVLLLWLGLAWRRARRTDPLRPRREAHARLAALLAQLRGAKDRAERSRLLLAWQHDVALLWQVAHAAPSAAAFASPKGAAQAAGVRGPAPGSDGSWPAIWREADRALYGADGTLPADWFDRAEAALAAKRVGSFSFFQLFLARNLLPFAAGLVLAGFVAASALAAESAVPSDPLAAYREGNFPAAEQAWRAALARQPTDWIARHDLSLALTQEDRPGEAAAQAAAAFLQHPRDPAVQWPLGPSFEQAGFTPEPFGAFVAPGAWERIVQSASPAEWQLLLIAGSALAALAGALWLFRTYGIAGGWVHPVAFAIFGLGLLTALTSVLARRAYGATADDQAVIAWQAGTLRSIPTEADTAQKTTPLAAGSVALADRTFLGWVRLSFANGQTGWVRAESVVSLWR